MTRLPAVHSDNVCQTAGSKGLFRTYLKCPDENFITIKTTGTAIVQK